MTLISLDWANNIRMMLTMHTATADKLRYALIQFTTLNIIPNTYQGCAIARYDVTFARSSCSVYLFMLHIKTVGIYRITQRVVQYGGWIIKWKECGSDQSWYSLRYSPRRRSESLRKTMEYLRLAVLRAESVYRVYWWREHLEDLGTEGKLILKWILRTRN